MDKKYENIINRYITKVEEVGESRMTRNLQPEIEKIKSVQRSLSQLTFINESEKARLRHEIQAVLKYL